MEEKKRVYGRPVEINQEDVKNLYINRSKKSETIHVDAPTVLSSDKNPEHINIWTEREVEHCLPYLKLDKGESVLLELGFGTGRMTRYIAPQVKQYVGIDYVQEFSDIVGHRTDMDFQDSMQFLTMSFQEFLEQRKILNMPEFNRFFVSGGVFMYINDRELEYCMEQLADCLQEKALLYLSEPIAREERLTLKQFYSDAMAEEYSAIYRTDQEYQKLFEIFYQRGFQLKVSEPLFDVDIKGRKETVQWVYVLERE